MTYKDHKYMDGLRDYIMSLKSLSNDEVHEKEETLEEGNPDKVYEAIGLAIKHRKHCKKI